MSSGRDELPLPPAESFSFDELYGEIDRRWRPGDLESTIRRLADPGAADDTLHWGRNYLYSQEVVTSELTLPVVVKQFRNEGRMARWRRRLRGSKAERCWRAGRRLEAAGVRTPSPVAWIESARPEGPSFIVTERVEGGFESRYLFRALLAGWRGHRFEGADVEATLRAIGTLIRRMHAAGVWHRDVSIGNLLITPAKGKGERPDVAIIDLGRSRLDLRLDLLRRLRDLCRLPVLRPEHRKVFLGAYWGRPEGPSALQDGLFVLFARGFLAKNRLKSLLRAPLRAVPRLFTTRRAYPHIPAAPSGAASRDKSVWDHLSDQPHQHAGRLERIRVRLADSWAHGRTTAAGLGALPGAIRREAELAGGLYSQPIELGDLGIAVQPRAGRAEEQLAALDQLGARKVLLRLYPWEEDQREAEAWARELHGRGYELAFVLAQNRALVSDPPRWRAAVEELGERFRPYGRHFQVGQAINRSKWGVWNSREYLDLAAAACEVLRAQGDVTLLGPPIIDFELHAYLGLLNLKRPEVFFDVLAAQLYVDRRGAPENPQIGYDTVGKVVVVKAIADRSPMCGDRMWITEFNWPLWEGPHSPAGRDASVDEERQADYLVRYALLTLGTGLVERAYWWQLVAKGYGLIDAPDGEALRCRPAFEAMAQLNRALAGSTFEGPRAPTDVAHLYRFTDREGRRLVVGWTPGAPVERALPAPAVEATDRAGRPLALRDPVRVELGPSPRYFWLEE